MADKTAEEKARDTRVGNMTLEELETIIRGIVDERNFQPMWPGQRRDRPVKEVLASMRRNIWTPPPGAKSSLELLREDRDR